MMWRELVFNWKTARVGNSISFFCMKKIYTHIFCIHTEIKYRHTERHTQRDKHTQTQYRGGIEFATHAKNDYYNYHFQSKVITIFSLQQNYGREQYKLHYFLYSQLGIFFL